MGVFAVISAAGADFRADIEDSDAGAGRTAKNPEGVVGAVLGREDVEVKLGLGLFGRGGG